MTSLRPVILAAALLGGAGTLSAQTPPPQPKAHEFTGKLFFVNTTGNSKVTSTGADGTLVLRPGWRWTHTEAFGVQYGRTEGTVSLENYRASHRTEMAFSGRVGLYGQLDFLRNRFKGLAAVYTYSLGLTAQVLSAPKDVISIEAGLGRVNQRNTSDEIQNFNSGRGAVVYRHTFSPSTYFEEAATVLPNLDDSDDLRMTSYSSLVAPISSHFGLNVTYRVEYDHQPQVGKKTTDTALQTGLQINF